MLIASISTKESMENVNNRWTNKTRLADTNRQMLEGLNITVNDI